MVDKALLNALADYSYGPPWHLLRRVAAQLAYPIAERAEKRAVRVKIAELERFYASDADQRTSMRTAQLAAMLHYAGTQVPYYRDLFASLRFDPARVAKDPQWLGELPVLTKAILAEQGDRMLARPLADVRHHAMTTGGSTGRKATIYYDQEAADYAAAVTAYARTRITGGRDRSNLHFAARLPDTSRPSWPSRETFKCLAMNRSNVFFDTLDDRSLAAIWTTLKRRHPYLVHGHPSTLHALATYVSAHIAPPWTAFDVFESSGEVLSARQRRDISEVFGCRIVDRYGLAEFGVVAYDFEARGRLLILESECWLESGPADSEGIAPLILTGLRNRLMPLIRYETGDLAKVRRDASQCVIEDLVGRVHDRIELNGMPYLTHFLQDVIDHRIGGIIDFQVDLRGGDKPILRLALENETDRSRITSRVETTWPGAFRLEFVALSAMIRVGDRAKFRHVVAA